MRSIAVSKEEALRGITWRSNDEGKVLGGDQVVGNADHSTEGHECHLIRGHVMRYRSTREVRVRAGVVAYETRESRDALGRLNEVRTEIQARFLEGEGTKHGGGHRCVKRGTLPHGE